MTAKPQTVRHKPLAEGQLHVIKVGTSSLLTNDEGGQKPNLSNISRLVELIASLRKSGDHVVLVSSGAVGMGCLKLGLSERPKAVGAKQAIAAAGQSRLMRLYEDLFQVLGVHVAQLLITRQDFSDERRFLAVRSTLYECLRMGVVPIINENDSLKVEHVQDFGDNDTMAAMTAALVEADWLFLATDVDFLYTANPKDDPSATPIHVVDDVATLKIGGLEASSSQWGTGGMATKLIAARIAVCAGVHCGLVNGAVPERVAQLIRGDKMGGTHFTACKATKAVPGDRNRWILTLPVAGSLTLDRQGYSAVLKRRSVTLDMVLTVTGKFMPDEAVALVHEGNEVARALVQSSSADIGEELKESSSGIGLRDFTRELAAAGIYLTDYNNWRRGGVKGARGEMNAAKMKQIEADSSKTSADSTGVVALSGDIALIDVKTIKEAEAMRAMASPLKRSAQFAMSVKEFETGTKRRRSVSPAGADLEVDNMEL
eukprot:gnl/TRDRNA2_/TRDRNA2_160772_c1_seq1.p1 gnl/TRDRNA2_/TRDRNA2_160772_c1~~gnl/TRDRNA2_/TRDRNA2_160772_c1_seq1.p1  ORF type:complete len:486 (+),score=104.61 gnl/TRDRNA2_/TRDRNA2_160772_c1_seq1:49-1506(+)